MFCDSNAFLKDPNHRVHNHFIELDLKKKNQDPSKGRYLKAEDRCSLKVFAFFRDHALTRLLFDDGAALFFFAYAIYANVDAYRGFGESFHFRQAVGTVNTLNDAWYVHDFLLFPVLPPLHILLLMKFFLWPSKSRIILISA